MVRVMPTDPPGDPGHIDRKLSAQAVELLERLESHLPPGMAAMFQFYNPTGTDLDLILATLGRHDPGDALRVLQAVRDQYIAQHPGRVRRYVAPIGDSPSDHVVSSATVHDAGAHEVVRVWSRGGLAGELVVGRGDGARLCCVLFDLEAALPTDNAAPDVAAKPHG
jgi:hypothetical protein